jgi:hypothetical protein
VLSSNQNSGIARDRLKHRELSNMSITTYARFDVAHFFLAFQAALW